MESRIADVELAFGSLHKAQCSRCGIARSATDFNSALKELDGTFVETQKAQDIVIVSFQNPSIRDFMQYLLLSGEMLSEVISALVFFEQAQWFIDKLNEETPQEQQGELIKYGSEIVGAFKRLLDVRSCSITIIGMPNRSERIAEIGSALREIKGQGDDLWMAARISEITNGLLKGELSPTTVVDSIEKLKERSYLDSEEGKQLILAMKSQAMRHPSDLDEFATLAEMIDHLPGYFDETEMEIIRGAYSDFANQYAGGDLGSPDDFREAANRIGDIGEMLEVDTKSAQDALFEAADEIEAQEEPDEDDGEYHGGGGGGSSDECSDRELDSIFGTLGN